MNQELRGLLKEFGFSEKEIDVYSALLRVGSAVASDIAKEAGINRSTTYVILDALLKRGLVSVTEKRGVKSYHSISPAQLIRHFKETADRYEGLAKKAKQIVPKLKGVKKRESGGEPRIQLFEGREGIKTVYEDAIASLEHIRVYAARGKEARTAPVSLEEFKKHPEIAVYGDKIILVSPNEDFAAVVESKELAARLNQILVSAKKSGAYTGLLDIRKEEKRA